MSYTSGVGNIQQAIDPIAPAEAKPAIQANTSDAAPNEGLPTNVAHADQTNLSSTGGLVAQAMDGSDTRSAKVASLQQAIATGSYSVSSTDVADKIIQSLLD